MKIVNRYLLSHFLRILLLTLSAFVGVYLLIDFFEKISRFIEHQASVTHYLRFLFHSVPVITSEVLPLAILMSMVLTLGSLGHTNETTAMRSCGLSLWRIIRSLMLFVFLISSLQLIANELLVPINARNLNHLLDVELQDNPQQLLSQGKIWYRDKGRIINVTLADPTHKKLQGISVFELKENSKLIRRLKVPEAEYQQDGWLAKTFDVYQFHPESGELLQSTSKTGQLLDLGRAPDDFKSGITKKGELNFQQNLQLIRKLQAEGFAATRYEVDMHSRLAAPFSSLVMAFLGVPFALRRRRGHSIAVGIGLSLGVGVAYFILKSMILAFGYSGVLPPIVAAWAINIIFLSIGIWLLLNLRE